MNFSLTSISILFDWFIVLHYSQFSYSDWRDYYPCVFTIFNNDNFDVYILYKRIQVASFQYRPILSAHRDANSHNSCYLLTLSNFLLLSNVNFPLRTSFTLNSLFPYRLEVGIHGLLLNSFSFPRLGSLISWIIIQLGCLV